MSVHAYLGSLCLRPNNVKSWVLSSKGVCEMHRELMCLRTLSLLREEGFKKNANRALSRAQKVHVTKGLIKRVNFGSGNGFWLG